MDLLFKRVLFDLVLDLVEREGDVFVLLLSRSKVRGSVAMTVKDPFRGEQSLNADRTSGVDPTRADAHLSPESEPVPVGESGRCVVKHARRVDTF